MLPHDLARYFTGLYAYTNVPLNGVLPAPTANITYLLGQHAIYKRGWRPPLDIVVPYATVSRPIPATGGIEPQVRWTPFANPDAVGPTPLPATGPLLAAILATAIASTATNGRGVARPVEEQFFVLWEDDPQGPTLGWRRAAVDQGRAFLHYAQDDTWRPRILVDIHSHHEMAPFFSATDNQDDAWLSVSCVIGHIFTRPTIRCRLCVYGTTYEVPAHVIWSDLGPFHDGYTAANSHTL